MATGITDSTIEEIKARTDIADLISSYGVSVKRAGSSMKACCPFHNEKTPSFNINAAKGLYHCFGCGESGDAIKFVQKMEGLSFIEAAKKLAAECGVKIEEREDPEAGLRKRLYALMAELAEFYRRCLVKTKEASVARSYLARREIDEKTQEDFLIGYAPSGASVMETWAEKHGYTMSELEAAGVVIAPKAPGDRCYHRFGGRLMFTVKDRQGRVVAFSGRQLVERKNSGKYVNSPETVIFKKSKVLFGFDRAAAAIAKSPHHEVICCEGQIDTIRLHVCGFTNAVASQGTAFTEEHAKMVKRVADTAVLMYDDDAAGHKATVKVARMLLAMEMPVRVVSLPGGDDPDSFLRKHGVEALCTLIDKAESVVAFQCRAEMAKEANPKSIDAVSRVTRGVVETIAACPSAILRASMADEASRILGLPAVALNEEVEKARAAAKSAPRPKPAPDGPERQEEFEGQYFPDGREPLPEPIPGELASAAEPPPALEREFMEFLMANEYDRGLDSMAGEFLPESLFSHDFTRRFVSAWRDEAVSGEDRFAEFADALGETERGWFDGVLLAAGKMQSCGLDATDVMQDFVRSLWCDWIRRERGALPADGGPDTDAKRLKMSMDLKRLQHVRWSVAKDIIRDLTR